MIKGHSRILWQNDGPTEWATTVYTHGDCWALAYYLGRELNTRVGLVGGINSWSHAVAETKTGFLDITGPQSKMSLQYQWLENEIDFVDPSGLTMAEYRVTIYEDFMDAPLELTYTHSYATARSVAKKLVRKYI